jgi:hypothetical protein
MAAKTLKEIIDERNFRTAAEKMAFAFGWNAAMDIKEAAARKEIVKVVKHIEKEAAADTKEAVENKINP